MPENSILKEAAHQIISDELMLDGNLRLNLASYNHSGIHLFMLMLPVVDLYIAPFLYPELEWNFRLPLVRSINVSGHKYGLVYAGIGWVVWRSKEDLPEELIFHINYQPTFTLNFSKGRTSVGVLLNAFFADIKKVLGELDSSARETTAIAHVTTEKNGEGTVLKKSILETTFNFKGTVLKKSILET